MRFGLAILTGLILQLGTEQAQPLVSTTPQIAHLNHMFAVVDAPTATAIEQSAFLRQFANFEVRTTTGTRSTWTGRYLRGKTTYLEFFAPEDFAINGSAAPVGAWGVAISGDRPGDLAKLARQIEAAGHKTLVVLETRKFADREVPWFNALTAITPHGDSGDLNATVTLWAMEYEPSYFALPEAEKEPAESGADVVSRERYQPDLFSQRMMRDVIRAEFAVSSDDFRRIEPMLVAAGFRLARVDGYVEADGEETDFRFWLTSTRHDIGVRRIDFSLNAPAPRRVEAIGQSTLTVGPDAKAVWIFHAAKRAKADPR